MAGPISRFITSGRLRLHYADWGHETAPPLLLLHGGRDHCRSWDDVARRLSADWHVIAPDLRGHGDSQWTDAGGYDMTGFIFDLVQLIRQTSGTQVTIVAHSLGGNIALRTTGLFPQMVTRLVAIEGLGPSPQLAAEQDAKPMQDRLRDWIAAQQQAAARPPRRYPSMEAALERMQAENPRLSPELALHLTSHGVRQNDDGTYSWKFDPHMRVWPPVDLPRGEIEKLWAAITCPVLLVYGSDSWASNPAADGRAAHFRDAKVVVVPGAGHWVHHDRLDAFMGHLTGFLSPPGE
jgi:pimeloyl-ACP methyl ester carboxylesterase